MPNSVPIILAMFLWALASSRGWATAPVSVAGSFLKLDDELESRLTARLPLQRGYSAWG